MNAGLKNNAGSTSQTLRRLSRWAIGMTILSLSITSSIVRADDATTKDDSNTVVAATVTAGGVTVTPPVVTPVIPTPGASTQIALQNYRPHDLKGLNVFEAPKDETPFTGKQLVWGFGFAQQYQGLKHYNSALPKMSAGVNTNQLIKIGSGFNNAVANLYLDAQLAKGIRVSMTSYLSARHHQESWVKDGYLLVDASPIDNPALNNLMKYMTLRVGHFEINYGDMHFRRSDNGNAFFNPFVGNLLLDAFTTEIGAEAYLRSPGSGVFAMTSVTGGEVHGQVTAPEKRSFSYIEKAGVDKQWAEKVRTRLTGSWYRNWRSASNTLYTGSRAGSRYYDVLENVSSTETANAWSGDIRPGFSNSVSAFVVNPFVKVQGFEFFGNAEQARGRAFSTSDPVTRVWTQYAGEGLYRFASEQFYVGGRYNIAQGNITGYAPMVRVERIQTGGGWYLTSNVLAKVEYVRQNYMNFPANDIRSGGHFNGLMVEGVVSF
jgi:hypothetical protein